MTKSAIAGWVAALVFGAAVLQAQDFPKPTNPNGFKRLSRRILQLPCAPRPA